MKKLVLAISILSILLMLSGCDFFGETPEKPWQGHSFNKPAGKQEFWLTRYETREWCIQDIENELSPSSDSWNKAWYSEPVGCSFSSNNLLLSIFLYETQADKYHYECIFRKYNPEYKKMKMKYAWLLKGYPKSFEKGECVWG